MPSRGLCIVRPFESAGYGPERCIDEATSYYSLHVAVPSQYRGTALLRQGGDQAVDRGAHGLAACSQEPVDLSRSEIETHSGRIKVNQISERLGDAVPAFVAAQSLEDLGDDDSAGAKVVVILEQSGKRCLLASGIAVQKVDPDRCVDQDPQIRSRRRSSSRSPSHFILPRNFSSSRTLLRRANSRSASLITSVFVLPGADFMALVSASSSRLRVVLIISLLMQIIRRNHLHGGERSHCNRSRRKNNPVRSGCTVSDRVQATRILPSSAKATAGDSKLMEGVALTGMRSVRGLTPGVKSW